MCLIIVVSHKEENTVNYNPRCMTSVDGGAVSKDMAHIPQNNTTTATLLVVLTVVGYLYIV